MHIILAYGGGNDLGRAYCLWLLVRELGWSASVYAHTPDWEPLRGSGMDVQSWEHLTRARIRDADAVIAYQPLPFTLGRVLALAEEASVPILVDIDDPHWEGRYGFNLTGKVRVVLGLIRRGRSPIEPYRVRRVAQRLPILLASPSLAPDWTGALIPHVRLPGSHTALPAGDRLRIAFVGTPRPHKGLDDLRHAVRQLNGVDLVITADRPDDAEPHEEWVGTTSLEMGREILANSHVAAVLQRDSPWTRRQFPVKVIDGMMAGRPVLATDVPPIRWALNSTGLLVRPGSPVSLMHVIERARDDRALLERLGETARSEALSRFTPAAVAPRFQSAVLDAVHA